MAATTRGSGRAGSVPLMVLLNAAPGRSSGVFFDSPFSPDKLTETPGSGAEWTEGATPIIAIAVTIGVNWIILTRN